MEPCSEEQLLAEDTGSRPASQRHPSASHADSSHSPQVSTPYQSIDSQQDLTSMPTNSLHHLSHQLPTSMHEQLAQQLPSSFASMSTSFMSPNSGALGQFDGQLPGQHQSLQMPDPHDSAWLQGQVAAALQEQQQQSTLAWQQASSALQSPGLNQDVQLLLFAHQQNLLAGSSQGPHLQQLYRQQQQQPYDQQHWDQQQQQQQLLVAAGLQGSLQSHPGSLQDAQPHHHAVSSSGEPIWSSALCCQACTHVL